VHGVSVPVHGVADADQLQPGVVHVACVVAAPQPVSVPVHVPKLKLQPNWSSQLVWEFAS
jgi:hypothetical protein